MAERDNPATQRRGLAERIKASFSRLAEVDIDALPLIGALSPDARYVRLAQILVLSVLLSFVCIGYYLFQVGKPARNAELAAYLQLQSQRVAVQVEQAARGEAAALTGLQAASQDFADNLGELMRKNPVGELNSELAALAKRWENTRRNVSALMAQRKTLETLAKGQTQFASRYDELLGLVGQMTPKLAGEAPGARMGVYQLAFLAQRLDGNIRGVMRASEINADAAKLIGEDITAFKQVLDGLLAGDARLGIAQARNADIRDKLFRMSSAFNAAEDQASLVSRSVPQLREVKRAAVEIAAESEAVFAITSRLGQAYAPQGSQIALVAAILFAFAGLASLLLLGLVTVVDTRRRGEEMAAETKRNQAAILRLLNEMGELAEGNLTIRASVTEDITGAIADAVNFAIEELQSLVENVNRAAEQVTAAADGANQVTAEMLASADRQSQEVAKTTEAVNHMSQSIARVSKHAGESARVAQQSLASAKRGGEAVRNTISGMDSIRDQIQETSKRIKRLGESSQEIGEILDLITDITEQTNVLALNAAIQAAAAGEAGRGFTVVAEEVQRLAERSDQATRRIGALVKTIQSDTQDAVHAMALSTQGVVEGTKLSDGAGLALRDIEAVSEELARLMQSISEATTDQATTAAQIANTMRRILAETRQTEESAHKSAQSIADLTALSDELKVSVAGFKL
jgi:twitching motility protein PilJ